MTQSPFCLVWLDAKVDRSRENIKKDCYVCSRSSIMERAYVTVGG